MSYKLLGFYKNSFDSTYLTTLFNEIQTRHPSITQSEIYNYQSSKASELNITNYPCVMLYKDDTLHRKLDYKLNIKEAIGKLRL